VKIPVTLQEIVLKRRSFIALIVLVVGLYMPIAYFCAAGLDYRFGLSLGRYINFLGGYSFAFGFLCCLVAPFLPKVSLGDKFAYLAAAIAVYIVDTFLSMNVYFAFAGFRQ